MVNINSRLLATLALSSSISISTYPPADYYSDPTLKQFDLYQNYISALCLALLVICFVLIPKRSHLHNISLVYLPAQIFIVYGVLPSSETEWILYTLKSLRWSALVGGFSFGECCSEVFKDLSLTSEVMLFSGISLLVMVGSCLLLVLMRVFSSYCLNIE